MYQPKAFYPSATDDVELLDISARAAERLHAAGINTVGALLQCTRKELLKIDGLGQVSLQSIADGLQVNGYSLK